MHNFHACHAGLCFLNLPAQQRPHTAHDESFACLQPQDAYGLEKLATEELCIHYDKDFGIECRIARFHNIYGPYGTWKGGREKAPAAFCRKALTSTKDFEMWGDGKQVGLFAGWHGHHQQA